MILRLDQQRDAKVFVDGMPLKPVGKQAFDLGLLVGNHIVQTAKAGYPTYASMIATETATITTLMEAFAGQNFASGLDALFAPGQQRSHEEVSKEFQRRQIQQVTLASGGTTTGSAFFSPNKHLSEIVFSVLSGERLRKVLVSVDGTGSPSAFISSDKSKSKKSSQTVYRRTSQGYEPVE